MNRSEFIEQATGIAHHTDYLTPYEDSLVDHAMTVIKGDEEIIGKLTRKCEDMIEILRSQGVCPDCLKVAQHHIDEPFSSCDCGTGEDLGERPLQRLQRVESAARAVIDGYRCAIDASEYPEEAEESYVLADRLERALIHKTAGRTHD